ncbi:ribose-phosphate diphosphokinase [Haliovirga abyssi]|uniref:Ribose-phosphate pyrophosphokinase n=1 Tax=Haliovirga abyssi TaxID=2996794 RepID=A0AAU9DF45_9FUSO|nr:ribose-phosphate pyrophosphokinase [Haliovirga abyssi]BDU50813.1 ribose-phosphate pyrophosphokinase [Haliovirga abyssi]
MKIFSGTSNVSLAKKIASNLGLPLGNAKIVNFKDGETYVRLVETVRGDTVFVVQPTSNPVNENLMELLIFIDALKRASAKSIVAVIPYYGYARQDRKSKPREPITSKLVANLLTSAGADRIMAMDLHANQIQGFFDIPADHIEAMPILAKYFLDKGLSGDKVIVVSPDVGGVKRARALSEWLGSGIAIIDKRRPKPNVAEVMNVIGKVEGKIAIFIDDMIDTAGTITSGVDAILDRGAIEAYACCTHPVFSGPAIERLKESRVKEIIVTNSIELPDDKKLDKIKVLSVDLLLSEAIRRVYNNESLSELFEKN